jgi:hypothetical protein
MNFRPYIKSGYWVTTTGQPYRVGMLRHKGTRKAAVQYGSDGPFVNVWLSRFQPATEAQIKEAEGR